jgi:hypothetical protein
MNGLLQNLRRALSTFVLKDESIVSLFLAMTRWSCFSPDCGELGMSKAACDL